MSKLQPYLIEFPKIGHYTQGYISISEGNTMPIDVKRVYWTYFTPEEVIRGNHAHHQLEQILFAAAGRISVEIEAIDGTKSVFHLEKPNVGLFVPMLSWHTMQYSHNAIQICLASIEYDELDYIRDYGSFKELQTTWSGTK